MRSRLLQFAVTSVLTLALWASPARAGFTEWADTLGGTGADLLLEWGDRAPVCGYRVTRSTVPTGPFTDISGALVSPFFEDLGAATGPPDTFFYLIEID